MTKLLQDEVSADVKRTLEDQEAFSSLVSSEAYAFK